MIEKPDITVIGGGTGSFTLLSELKNFTPSISAIVNMSDDGGSTGRLRDELGVLPGGDIRQCLVALSEAPEVRDMFSHRFGYDGSMFSGHSLGNILIAGLELQYKDFAKAIRVASSFLRITGRVIPVTLENNTLVLEDGDETIRGESTIGNRKFKSLEATLRLDPEAPINPEAEDAILKTKMVVIAPGNLYGSLLPTLAVKGMAEALAKTRAKKVVVINLVTKPGQTDGWHVVDYVKKIEEYIGEGSVDAVLHNTAPPSRELLEKYAAEGEFPVGTDPDRFKEISAQVCGADVVEHTPYVELQKDLVVPRTLIRHNGRVACKELIKIYNQS